jgi:E3 ubiquitin-protein ligase UBR4
MRENLLSEILEALIVIRGLIVQKTKLISDCNRLLKDLLDSLLLESSENKRQFIKACINGLQIHGKERKGRACLVWINFTFHFPKCITFSFL